MFSRSNLLAFFCCSFLLTTGCFHAGSSRVSGKLKATENFLQSGKDALQKGDRAEAEVQFRSALSSSPTSLEAHLLLGGILGPENPETLTLLRKARSIDPKHETTYRLLSEALLQQNRIDEAEAIAKEGLRLSHKAPLYVVLGMTSVYKNKLGKAKEAFLNAIQLTPKSIQPRLLLATVYVAENDLLEAAKAFAGVVELDPYNPMARMGLADIFLRTGASKESIPVLEEIQWKRTPPASYFSLLGSAYLANNRYFEAAAALSKAVQLQPDRAEYVAELSRAFLLTNETEAATKLLEEAIVSWPEEQKILLMYGRVLWKNNDLTAARKQFEKILSQNEKDLTALTFLGTVALQQKDFETALSVFSKTTRLYPELAEPEIDLGNTYQQLGQIENAAKAYERAQKLAPKDMRPSLYLASLYAEEAPKKALQIISTALAGNPQHVDALLLRASLLIKVDRFKDAIKTFEEALKIEPDSILVNNNFAWALVYEAKPKNKDCDRGLTLAKRAVELSESKRPAELDTLAEAYRCHGEYDKALQMLDKALALDPDKEFFLTHREEIEKESKKRKKKRRR